MPINRKMMKSLIKTYWKEKAKKIYFAIEMKNKKLQK